MSNTNDLNKRTLTLERVFNAPIKLVWEAWTQPDHIAKWWGPKGMEVSIVEHSFKVGGAWKFAMVMPDGKEFITEGIYSEIVPEKKIISSADFKPMTEGVEIQAHFEGLGDKTKFVFKVVHETEEYCKQQEEMGFYNGWGSVFENLNEFLNAKVAES
ncbi:MAG: SRPBCC domain-containing protein [Reichenbachiella sp.]|uniref:SRPBCC family protein n=1 Tax=Reichenbachiella sp. TaxID=2184521 RepID=UPI003266F094